MALRNLGRKLMGQALNKGSPSVVSAASLARPLSTLPFSLNNNRRTNSIHPLLSFSPKLAMALPQVRYASTKPESEDKAAATAAPASDKPATVSQKLKKMWEAYGVIAVGTYLSVYVTTLGSLFLALDYDVFNAATVGLDPTYAIHMFCDVVERVTGNTHVPEYIRENPHVGTFAIAWVMTKFTEPFRLAFTIATVPSVARILGKKENKPASETEQK